MTKETPEGSNPEDGIGTVVGNDIGNEHGGLGVDLNEAPVAMTRLVQFAACSGEFGTLVEGGVWRTQFDDWALFLNGGDEATVETYEPWGEFNIEPLTAVVFRTGMLAGVTDEQTSEFMEGGPRSEKSLLVEVVEQRLDEANFDYETHRRAE